MVAWGDVRNTLRGDLWRSATGVPDDVCDRWLHTSLREIEGIRRWLWLEQIETNWQPVDDQPWLVIPASLTDISSVAFLSSPDSYDLLAPTPLHLVRELAATNTAPGFPTCYARSGGLLYVDTVVTTTDLFEIIGTWRTPIDLAECIASAVSNYTLQRETQAVLSLACNYVALNYLKDETNAARHLAAFQRHQDRLIDEEDAARSDVTGGCIVPDTAYQQMAFGPSFRRG